MERFGVHWHVHQLQIEGAFVFAIDFTEYLASDSRHRLQHACVRILREVQLVLRGLLVLSLGKARRQDLSIVHTQVKRVLVLFFIELFPSKGEANSLFIVVELLHVSIEVIIGIKFSDF